MELQNDLTFPKCNIAPLVQECNNGSSFIAMPDGTMPSSQNIIHLNSDSCCIKLGFCVQNTTIPIRVDAVRLLFVSFLIVNADRRLYGTCLE